MRVRITRLHVAIMAVPVIALALWWTFANSPMKAEIVTKDQVVWRQLGPGLELAVVFGNIFKKDGLYVIRIRTKGEIKSMPHWHETDEHITVLEGTMWNGLGEQFDASKLQEMKVGTHAVIPAGVRHFTLTKDYNVIEQFGEAPVVVTYVNPDDDPRKFKSK